MYLRKVANIQEPLQPKYASEVIEQIWSRAREECSEFMSSRRGAAVPNLVFC
jgi:hypothetical protein